MPPKKAKKGKGKKKGGEKGPKGPKLKAVPEGLHTSEMTKGQLMSMIKRLLAEDQAEVMEKNLFLLEKNKLFEYWSLCMDKVKILKDEVERFAITMDQSKKQRDAEKDYQDHKFRHLQSEEMSNCGKVRLQHLKYMKRLSDENWGIENILRDAAVTKRMQIRAQMRAQFEILRSLHSQHSKTLHDMMLNLGKSVRSKEIIWERHFDSRRDAATANLVKNDGKLSQMKLQTLDYMNDIHEKALQDLKTFFNDMTSNNFAVIDSLQEEVDDVKAKNNRLGRDLRSAKEKYLSATDPLEEMQRELVVWEEDSQHFEELTKHFQKLDATLQAKLQGENNLSMLVEVLLERIELAEQDNDQVQTRFSKGILAIQKQMTMKNLVQELQLKSALKDRAVLEAMNQAVQLKSPSPIRKLQTIVQEQQKRIRTRIQESQVPFSCKKPTNINLETRNYGQGLVRAERTILPPIITSKDNKKYKHQFDGRAQGITSHIYYKGKDFKPKASSRELGYGYYHIPPNDLSASSSSSSQVSSRVESREQLLLSAPQHSNSNTAKVQEQQVSRKSSQPLPPLVRSNKFTRLINLNQTLMPPMSSTINMERVSLNVEE